MTTEDLKLCILQIKHRKAEIAHEKGGLMASIGQSIAGPRFYETDEWFDKQKAYLDSLELQLRGLVKAIDVVAKHRSGEHTHVSLVYLLKRRLKPSFFQKLPWLLLSSHRLCKICLPQMSVRHCQGHWKAWQQSSIKRKNVMTLSRRQTLLR